MQIDKLNFLYVFFFLKQIWKLSYLPIRKSPNFDCCCLITTRNNNTMGRDHFFVLFLCMLIKSWEWVLTSSVVVNTALHIPHAYTSSGIICLFKKKNISVFTTKEKNSNGMSLCVFWNVERGGKTRVKVVTWSYWPEKILGCWVQIVERLKCIPNSFWVCRISPMCISECLLNWLIASNQPVMQCQMRSLLCSLVASSISLLLLLFSF